MTDEWILPCGLRLRRQMRRVANDPAREMLVDALGTRRGLLLRCNFTYPGRYRPRWVGFVDPPLEICCAATR